MWAYIDETGNTGNHLFDPQQPFFVTAAMMTRTNFDLTASASMGALAASLGVQALHANTLGLSRLEDIAPKLLKILRKNGAHFVVSRLEKRYLAATKAFDTYFDAGENLAVPWHIYWLRPLRLTVVFKLAYFILTDDIAQTVWNCVTASSEAKSKAYFVDAAVAMRGRVQLLPDERSRQVVTDALQWAIDNPNNFSTYLKDKINRYGHSPNFVAFNGIELAARQRNRPIQEIVHDRQSQFEKTIGQWHEVVSRPDLCTVEPIYWPGEKEPHSLSKAPGSTFRTATEETSAGLQAIDVVLWLFKRVFDGKDLGPNTAKLINWVSRRALQHDFSFQGVGMLADKQLTAIMEADLTEAQIAEGAKMRADYERTRLQNMEAYTRAKLSSAEDH